MKIELDQEVIDRLLSKACTYQIRYKSDGEGRSSMFYGFEGEQPDDGQAPAIYDKAKASTLS